MTTWSTVAGGSVSWSEVAGSGGGASSTLFGGMPLGLLLLFTYSTDESVLGGANWSLVTSPTTIWS